MELFAVIYLFSTLNLLLIIILIMLENLETNGFYQCFSNLWCNSNNGLYCDSTGVCSCPSTHYWTGSVCSKKLIEEDILINRCYNK